jgi:serpin B
MDHEGSSSGMMIGVIVGGAVVLLLAILVGLGFLTFFWHEPAIPPFQPPPPGDLVLAAGDAPAHDLPAPAREVPEAEIKKLTAGNADFAFDLYARLIPEGQFFIAPHSISTELAMLYAGARGATAEEIAKVCRFGASPDELAEVHANLVWRQRTARKGAARDTSYAWHEANGLWGRRGASFRLAYVDLLRLCVAAETREADFADPAAAAEIARWVASQTQDKISSLPLATTAETQLVLVSAVYFKAGWQAPFRAAATYDEAFHVTATSQAKVSMMHGEQGHYQYLDEGAFEMIDLPFKGGASMLVLLPKKVGLDRLDPFLTGANLAACRGKMHDQAARVTLPKLELKYEIDLAASLRALGMKQAMSPGADYSGMLSAAGFFCEKVMHAAYVKVDEKGAEAAAVTAAQDKSAAPRPKQPIHFHVNRPFVFLIMDHGTGSVLFLGRVTNPGKQARPRLGP